MKVLLIGEYSGVHTNLAKALRQKEVSVLTIHDGDAYKKFPADINISYKYLSSNIFLIKKFLNLYYLILTYLGVIGCFQILKYFSVISKLKNYDVVQIINPIALAGYGSIVNYFFIRYIVNNNKKMFMCALGDDYIWVDSALKDKKYKSMFHNIDPKHWKEYIHPFMYKYGFFYKKLNYYTIKKSRRIIPGLYDYYMYYKKFSNCNEIVPIPMVINENVKPLQFISYPIKIFHGWQPNKIARKGNDILDEAVRRILKNYPDLIDYEIIGGISYNEYIRKFDESFIYFDQCYSLDRGVNALLGMEAGKVVFGGFSKEVKSIYNISKDVMIDIEPNVDDIYNKLEKLILDPKIMEEISINSIKFITEYHSLDVVSDLYLNIWMKY